MSEIDRVAENLVKAIKDVYEATDAFAIDTSIDGIFAQVQPEDFEKVARDRNTRLRQRGLLENEYPYQKEVMIGGVKFFCLLTEEEKAKEVACR